MRYARRMRLDAWECQWCPEMVVRGYGERFARNAETGERHEDTLAIFMQTKVSSRLRWRCRNCGFIGRGNFIVSSHTCGRESDVLVAGREGGAEMIGADQTPLVGHGPSVEPPSSMQNRPAAKTRLTVSADEVLR